MSSRSVRWLLLAGLCLALGMVGCGYGSNMNGLPPNIAQLMPNAAAHGSATFSMTVVGNYFGTDSVVYFNGNPLQTAYTSTTQVTAQVPAADVTTASVVQVYVRTGGQNSNMMAFTIQ